MTLHKRDGTLIQVYLLNLLVSLPTPSDVPSLPTHTPQNNSIQMKTLLISHSWIKGIDLDQRIGPWANAILTSAFQDRCESAGPYFDCNHPIVDLRPTPVHLAVFFNAQGVLGALVFAGAKSDELAWFADCKVLLPPDASVAHAADADAGAAIPHVGAFGSGSPGRVPTVVVDEALALQYRIHRNMKVSM
jgi:hypothetical protein